MVDLYERFKEVKTYYDFVFDPKEEKLIGEAKMKIRNEYFPKTKRKPKARRSVAQKLIRHYLTLGVEARLVLELMFYNIEIAQQFASEKSPKNPAFYKSILKSFQQAVSFGSQHKLENRSRIVAITSETKNQHWQNASQFDDVLAIIE